MKGAVMAEPTPQELLELIEELQALVSADYAPPEGPEISYPAVGQAVDDEMWKFVTLALGSGVIDTGGRPYWLGKLGTDSETNSENQMIFQVDYRTGNAQAILNGFYHRLLENMRLDFPMPLTETTYYVVLELNPLKARDPEGPIAVRVYPNELNTESGREHLILWTVTRKPNQLLTDAVIERIRPRVAPNLVVAYRSHLPNPESVLWGTTATIHSATEHDVVIAKGLEDGVPTRWESVLSGGWIEHGDSASYKWPGAAYGYPRALKREGNTRKLRGVISRASGGDFVPGGGESGYLLYSLSKIDAPEYPVRLVTAGTGTANPRSILVVVNTNGEVRGWPYEQTGVIFLDGIEWDVG